MRTDDRITGALYYKRRFVTAMTQPIHIGNQTATSATYARAPFDFALKYGFDAFEWFSDKKGLQGWHEADFDTGTRADIRETGMRHNIYYSVHAPWQANPLHADGVLPLYTSVDFAHDIGAKIVNLHLYMEKGPHEYVKALLPVIHFATSKNVRISVENTPHTSPEDFNQIFAAFKATNEVSAKNVGMCLDIGHANITDSTRFDYIKYIDRLSPDVPIIHLHVHENYGDHDSHLALFTGPSAQNDAGIRAFLERLKRRKYEGAMIMEQWPHDATQLLVARARLRMLLEL